MPKMSLNCISSYHSTLEGQRFDSKKIYIFLGNLSMTHIIDFNRFQGKKNIPKFWIFIAGLTHVSLLMNPSSDIAEAVAADVDDKDLEDEIEEVFEEDNDAKDS